MVWGNTVFYFILFSGVLSFIFFHFHYLYLLLSLEIIMLSLYFIFSLGFFLGISKMSFLIYFLVFFVCESVFGISLLISYVRSSGVEMFGSGWPHGFWVM
uniref:NADH dehydrogenase subunit 4L n=1 Tax=Hygrobates taniguchii TaxID=2759127 RepID=A0A6J4EE71_9ACAR|nr:NADH dehydrogenase subunit 4L [Hygrobates taniguchii]